MAKESIYNHILRMTEQQPGLPYRFQNPLAGRQDVGHVMWGPKSPATFRRKWALELADLIIPCLPERKSSPELLQQLKRRPLFLYLSEFSRRLRLLLGEGLIDDDDLYAYGMQLATESANDLEVKLGMLILGQFENDVSTKIMRTLGLHSSLTLYAGEASGYFRSQNQFIFYLAQHTQGFGKLVALHVLQPIREQQKQWVFNQGAHNYVATNLAAALCLEKTDMASFYMDMIVTGETFPKLSHLLAFGGERGLIQKHTISLPLVEKYIAAGQHARTFIDLAALVVLRHNMQKQKDKKKLQNGWTVDKEQQVERQCQQLINLPRWENVVNLELASPLYPSSLVLFVLTHMGTTPSFASFRPRLQRSPFDMAMLKFLLLDNPEEYLDDVQKYLKSVLPQQVIEDNPQNITKEKTTARYHPDMWLASLLRAMRKAQRFDEDLYVNSLSYRFPGVRLEACKCLHAFRNQWSENVLPALKRAGKREPIPKLAQHLQDMVAKVQDQA